MTHPDDDFDLDAFDSAFAKEFGEPLAAEPEVNETEAVPSLQPRSMIAMVLTPVADARVLARLMGLVKIQWPVFATRTGAAAATVLEIDEVAQLTGSIPPEAIKVAQALSRTSEFGVVLLTSLVGEGEDGASGHIQAVRYVGGEEVETLSPGVVLAGADDTVEKVIFGQVTPQDAQGALDPTQVVQEEEPEDGPSPKRRWGRKSR